MHRSYSPIFLKRSTPFKILCACLLFFAFERFCRIQTGGFRLHKASVRHSYPFTAPTAPPLPCLDQPFYFLGSGVQFYVFEGKDGQTILKLFKHHHLGPSTDTLETLFPKGWIKKLIEKRERRMHHLLTSAKIAEEKLKSQTAVMYTHLEKTEGLLGEAKIYDKLGICHRLNLDRTEFVLQKKAEPLAPYLTRLLKEGEKEKAKASIASLLSLIEERSRLGIKNKDQKVLENCGFINDQPFELDIGSFVTRTKSTHPNPHQKAAMRAKRQIFNWLKKNRQDENII
jgi:hypothetical protein